MKGWIMMSNEDAVRHFVNERNKALWSMDEAVIRRWAEQWGYPDPPKNERIFWGGVCKAICNITATPEQVRQEAEKRLRELGFSTSIG